MKDFYLENYVSKQAGVLSSSARALADMGRLVYNGKRLSRKGLRKMRFSQKRDFLKSLGSQASPWSGHRSYDEMPLLFNYADNLKKYYNSAEHKAFLTALRKQSILDRLQNPGQYAGRNFLTRPLRRLTAQSWMRRQDDLPEVMSKINGRRLTAFSPSELSPAALENKRYREALMKGENILGLKRVLRPLLDQELSKPVYWSL